ncbi:hypothetical protein COL27_01565 [Bacillus sp. AFS075960]|nr:hypothetical protein COJ53_08220 [Bacillus cereus]PFW87006.1 hypothetical protein COL27_01565 [Bacillus sp. AFS075960]PGU97597.1 hypothetical protein COD71_01400 [Bacillus cereus]
MPFLIENEKDFGLHNKLQSKVLFSSAICFMYVLDGRMWFYFAFLRRINSNIPIRNVESPIKIDAG